jgi:hypothetical protein
MRKRADAILDLVDALTVAGYVDSPVALSEETPFRRKFSSIFDTLRHGEIDFDLFLPVMTTSHRTAKNWLVVKYMAWIAPPMSGRKPRPWKTGDR